MSQNQVVVSADTNGMTAGIHYFFTYKFRNSEGDSPQSDSLEVALADYPQKPAVPLKDDTKSSLTSIYVEWTHVPTT